MQKPHPFEIYEPLPPQLKPADPLLILVADAVIGILIEKFPHSKIEHFGSTAVPDLAGSGIIDLMMVCPSGQLSTVSAVLEEMGFQNPRPNDLPDANYPLKVALFTFEGKTFPIHLHILDENSPRVDEFRTFRDRLRLDAGFRAAYQDLKRSFFAKRNVSSAEYARLKSEFIQKSLNKT